MAKQSIRNRKGQAGAAMLIMVAILTLGITSLVLAALKSSTRNEVTDMRNRNAAALAQAKEALIGYVAKQAASYTESAPGELPCPESPADAGTINEGRANNNNFCTPTDAVNQTVGRLPWRTLGIDKLVDGASEPLWYAVSQNWVPAAGPTPPTVNPGSAGQLSADGVTDVVAIIIAPGSPLKVNPTGAQAAQGCLARNQTRNDRSHVAGGGNPDYRDYLECENASSPIDLVFGTSIVNNATNPVINDQVVTITASEILNAIQGPLSERLQRTVAPLLSEFSDSWVAGGKFMPYAVSFTPPESALAPDSHCGTAALNEGLLPIAPTTSVPCSSMWTGSFTGDGINSSGCNTASPVTCSFQYYRLNLLGQLVFGILGSSSITATLQATAPHAAASFRAKSVQNAADITTTGGPALSNFSIAPKTNGNVELSVQATVSSSNICQDSMLGGLLCSVAATLGLANASTVTLRFAQLGTPMVQGTKLPAAVLAASSAPPFNLLSPGASQPHYWFMQNQWYRYTYYAVAGSASAAATGGNLTITGFPTDNGVTNDKRFVLALMGPAVSGQARGAAAALANYVEGANAATTASPRVFAYEVYSSPGNDRVATCPYTLGATSLCD